MNEQNNQQNNEPVQEPKNKNIWMIIVSVVVTALVVGGGIYAWQRSNLKSTEESLQQQIIYLQNQVEQLQGELVQSTGCPPPQIHLISTKGGDEQYLNLCGEDTEYPAHEFKEDGFILFQQDNSLKAISLKAPYEQETLIEFGFNMPSDTGIGKQFGCHYEQNLYKCSMLGEGPGLLTFIFIFNPKNKKYILVEDLSSVGDARIIFASSWSNKIFEATIDRGCVMGGYCGEYENMKPDDIQAEINGIQYTKQEVIDNLDNVKTLFDDCNRHFDFLDFYSIWEDKIKITDINDFPPKTISCLKYNETHEETVEIGYIDLEKSEFIIQE